MYMHSFVHKTSKLPGPFHTVLYYYLEYLFISLNPFIYWIYTIQFVVVRYADDNVRKIKFFKRQPHHSKKFIKNELWILRFGLQSFQSIHSIIHSHEVFAHNKRSYSILTFDFYLCFEINFAFVTVFCLFISIYSPIHSYYSLNWSNIFPES